MSHSQCCLVCSLTTYNVSSFRLLPLRRDTDGSTMLGSRTLEVSHATEEFDCLTCCEHVSSLSTFLSWSRVLKDPIRVHKRQIDELNRLLAWRVAPSGSNRCERDTAGRVSSDGNRVELNREVQYKHLQHRMVFCECKDWPSKFESDQEWCSGWREDAGQKRFYGTPYSFDTNGEW